MSAMAALHYGINCCLVIPLGLIRAMRQIFHVVVCLGHDGVDHRLVRLVQPQRSVSQLDQRGHLVARPTVKVVGQSGQRLPAQPLLCEKKNTPSYA